MQQFQYKDTFHIAFQMDPSLAYDAIAGPQHDVYSYGYIIKEIGTQLFIPELEKIGMRIMQSRPQTRSEGGSLCARHVLSELRTLTFRNGGCVSPCAPLACYELCRLIQRRSVLAGMHFI